MSNKRRSREDSEERRRRQRGGRRREDEPRALVKPDCPPAFRCHQCDGNHWTVDCIRVRREPHRYPKIDIHHGCFQCGQRGHPAAKCPVKREKCKECGGMHSSTSCPFSYVPQEWHEFYDATRKHVYYCHSETQAVTWDMPANPLDVLLWHCDVCRLLLPDELKECVQCHAQRPVTADAVSGSSSGGDTDDEGSSSDDSLDDEVSVKEEDTHNRNDTEKVDVSGH